jgi:CBS domain-containing protein
MDNGHLVGVLGLRDVAAIPKAERGSKTVAQVMVPWESLSLVGPETELMDALQLMDDQQVAQLPVVMGNQMLGMISREHVLHYIRIRSELKV